MLSFVFEIVAGSEICHGKAGTCTFEPFLIYSLRACLKRSRAVTAMIPDTHLSIEFLSQARCLLLVVINRARCPSGATIITNLNDHFIGLGGPRNLTCLLCIMNRTKFCRLAQLAIALARLFSIRKLVR